MIVPTERIRALESSGTIRPIDHRALFAFIPIGVGSMAGATDAARTIYGFDLVSQRGRTELAMGLVRPIVRHDDGADEPPPGPLAGIVPPRLG